MPIQMEEKPRGKPTQQEGKPCQSISNKISFLAGKKKKRERSRQTWMNMKKRGEGRANRSPKAPDGRIKEGKKRGGGGRIGRGGSSGDVPGKRERIDWDQRETEKGIACTIPQKSLEVLGS